MQIKQEEIRRAKANFGIIGNNADLNLAIERALKVANTDLSVLITGDSGVGKEAIPKVIHHFSQRRSEKYIAVNCGSIPEGTLESELFGHVKGSFTGAESDRRGYFETANNGTIFLDEVGELPLTTQAKLLRVLESGEFLKMGSSAVQKTDVRIIAATNINFEENIKKGKFRKDLYYRISSVPISLPPLRERGDDIYLLFRKFSADFSEKTRRESLVLSDDAIEALKRYAWPGNIRELKNLVERISILETKRSIDAEIIYRHLPTSASTQMPILFSKEMDAKSNAGLSEREILYKILFELKDDVTRLKELVFNAQNISGEENKYSATNYPSSPIINYPSDRQLNSNSDSERATLDIVSKDAYLEDEVEDALNLDDHEKALIIKALKKHDGKRAPAAKDLGISDRTLYRKIDRYGIKL
tara:strand:+ start:144637 stop:145887 length:1251 start_codon:yes stop_codon:yes gene_type:complete